jgi:hypothetical protein
MDSEVELNGKTLPFRFTFGTNNLEMILMQFLVSYLVASIETPSQLRIFPDSINSLWMPFTLHIQPVNSHSLSHWPLHSTQPFIFWRRDPELWCDILISNELSYLLIWYSEFLWAFLTSYRTRYGFANPIPGTTPSGDQVWLTWINNQEVQWYEIGMWSWNEDLSINQRRDYATILWYDIQTRCSRRKFSAGEFSQTLWYRGTVYHVVAEELMHNSEWLSYLSLEILFIRAPLIAYQLQKYLLSLLLSRYLSEP